MGELKPVFILGAHKSGTSLLRSLFDGHDEFQVLPIETHIFSHLGYEICYPLRKQVSANRSLEQVIEHARKSLSVYNDLEESLGDAALKNEFDMVLFDQVVSSCSAKSQFPTAFFNAIHESFYKVKIDPNKYVVEKSVEHHEFTERLISLFPKAKFIHIIRNPYANIVALRKYSKSIIGRYPYEIPHVLGLRHAFECAVLNRQTLDKNYSIITFESLVSDAEKTMRDICRFLNIEYNEALIAPTVKGNIWRGNSTSNVEMSGINSTVANNWIDEINDYEIFIVNRYLSEYLSKFNYSKINRMAAGFWKPDKSEKWREYLKNRYKAFF